MRKIVDFGEKIGGARKDLWKTRGIQEEDLYEMTEEEKKFYVTRDNVWPLANAKKLVEEDHVEPYVAYWQRQVRLLVFKEPVICKTDNFSDKVEEYVRLVQKIKTLVMSCKTSDDTQKAEEIFEQWKETGRYYIRFKEDCPYKNCISTKIFFIWRKHGLFRNRIASTGFPFQKKTQGKRRVSKKSFVPPQLEHIQREGEDYRHGIHCTPEKWQDVFSFRAVEFGNWLSQKDRQASMDYCFDALKDLAKALDVDDTDIAFQCNLALAFGARGCPGTSAHYEPMRRVINLTKMHGAGCTAHEWFHGLDHHIAKFYCLENVTLASEAYTDAKLPRSFRDLIGSLKTDSSGNKTDYYRGSAQFDKHFRKDFFGAWSSNAEMAARAFACYVKDCLGFKSDYLIAHADVYEFEFDNMSLCAHPQGEERELFNELFDQLFYDLKKDGFLHQAKIVVDCPIQSVAQPQNPYYCDYSHIIKESSYGQLSFQF